jgi:hypothetical protein
MNNKLKAIAILPLAASLTFFGLQAITASFAATSVESEETDATTGASALTIDDCDWYIDGVATELTLENDSGMEYVGDDYELSATNDGVKVYFSGTATEDVRCSFYDDIRGVDVDVSWEALDAGFSNLAAEDTSLDWVLGDALEEGGPSSLVVSYVPVDASCDAAFGAGGSVSIDGVNTSPLTPATISSESTGTFAPSATAGTETWAKCTLNATYTATLPGNQRPANPGFNYTFAGPNLVTTITVNDSAS